MKSNIFSKSTLIPAVIQDEKSKLVYMVGYMNQHALDLTIATKRVHFWSRSKGRIWMKGETSGNTLSVVQIIADCDEDALLIYVSLSGSHVCHTGSLSCFTHFIP